MRKNSENKKLAATLYLLAGLEATRYRFRILRVREPIPMDNLRSIRLQRWADKLWRRELRCPVYPTARLGYPAFLIPEENSPATGHMVEFEDVPDKLYHIEVTDQAIEVSIEDAVGAERDLVCRMLERPFTAKFQSLRNDFWRDQWTLFFRLIPENEGELQDIVNAYRGLKFGVVLLEGMGPHLAADVRTKYIGRRSLAEYSESDRESVLRYHLDLDVRVEDRSCFIRDNGTAKIPCRYTGETSQTIGECTYDDSGKTVFQYYRERYKAVSVDPKDDAVFVQDRTGQDSLPVPASRLFPVFTTEYEGLRECSVRSQMTPQERVATIASFLCHLVGVRYGGIPITIKASHLVKERTVFIPPRLEFGDGQLVDPFPKGYPPSRSETLFDSLVVKWSSRKLPALYEHGPYHNEPLPDMVLLYPDTINRHTREAFLSALNLEAQRQTGQPIRFIQQQSYVTGRSEKMGSSLLRLATQVCSNYPRGLAVVILWDHLQKSVHGELKETVSPMLSQCATERTVRRICSDSGQQAMSQLRNLVLAILTEAGVKPWVLADALHHDLHIGIDTLFERVGYHYLYGTGGRIIDRQFGECIVRGRWSVAIKKPDLRRRLIESIQSIVESGHSIESIVIHRDGRWWPSENEALQEAVHHLKTKSILPADARCAAVEIRKNHMPVRLFTNVESGDETFLQNPLPGTYLILDQNRVLLTTTGRPGAWDRRGVSAGSLLLEIAESIGEIDIEEIAEDAYWLTHLNWNAPDIEIAHPVTIRWTDEALRETLRSPGRDEEEEEEGSDADELADISLDEEDFIP